MGAKTASMSAVTAASAATAAATGGEARPMTASGGSRSGTLDKRAALSCSSAMSPGIRRGPAVSPIPLIQTQDILRYEDRLEPDEGGFFADDTDPWMRPPPPPNVTVGFEPALGPMQSSSRMGSLPRHKPHHAIGFSAPGDDDDEEDDEDDIGDGEEDDEDEEDDMIECEPPDYGD